MNGLAEKNQRRLAIPDDTKALITSGVSENTLRNYCYWSKEIEQWLDGPTLDDGLLAAYISVDKKQQIVYDSI